MRSQTPRAKTAKGPSPTNYVVLCLLATSAVILALVAARMTETHRRLAAVAVGVGAAAFVVGMSVAVLTDNGIY